MCLKLSISRMIADRLPSGGSHAGAGFRRALEETTAIAQSGQGIDRGESDQLALHGENPLCGPEPRYRARGGLPMNSSAPESSASIRLR